MTKWFGAWGRGRACRRESAEARTYRSRRISTIRAALPQAQGEFACLAGGSYAEPLGTPGLAEPATIDGGIGGATAPVYAAEIGQAAFSRPAALAVLFIGSSDIAAIYRPLTARGTARFAQGGDVPPRRAGGVGTPRLEPSDSPGPVYPMSSRRCPPQRDGGGDGSRARPTLPRSFRAPAGGRGGWAAPGAMADGTHFADHRPVAAAVAA